MLLHLFFSSWIPLGFILSSNIFTFHRYIFVLFSLAIGLSDLSWPCWKHEKICEERFSNKTQFWSRFSKVTNLITSKQEHLKLRIRQNSFYNKLQPLRIYPFLNSQVCLFAYFPSFAERKAQKNFGKITAKLFSGNQPLYCKQCLSPNCSCTKQRQCRDPQHH